MMQMDAAEVQRTAFRKRRRGEPLTPEEDAAFRAYFKDRARLRCTFYCVDADEKASLEAQAEADKYASFGDWCRDTLHRGREASTRTESEWADVLKRLEVAEARFEDQLAMTHELMEKASRYERERDDARVEVQDLRNALADTGRAA